MPINVDVCIVGGGLSGLVAARDLCRDGRVGSIAVLEGRTRLGGRLRTERTSLGKHIDLGGTWVGPQQRFVLALLESLGVPTYEQWTQGYNELESGPEAKLSKYNGTIPRVNPITLLDVHFLLRRLDKLATRVIGPGRDAATENRWDGMSLGEFAKHHCMTAQARSLMAIAVRMILGVEPEQVTLLYFLRYAAAAGGINPLLDAKGGAQDSRIKGGSHAMVEALAAELRASTKVHVEMVMDFGVRHVECTTSSAKDGLITLQGRDDSQQVTARHVIFACAPSALRHIRFTPDVAPLKRDAWRRSSAACYTKAVVEYQRPFWRNNGLSGNVTCEHPSPTRPISGVYDYCDEDGSRPALMVFIVGDPAMALAGMAPAKRQEAVVSHLVRLFGPEATDVAGFTMMDWAHDPDVAGQRFGSGCPVDISAMGYLQVHGPELARPEAEGRVHFAGTETAEHWPGYMDGAVEAGQRAAREVLAKL
eukprot:jgi/Mesvir1/26204/Mv02388-RA.1